MIDPESVGVFGESSIHRSQDAVVSHFDKWLENKSHYWSRAIAVRMALRVLPFAFDWSNPDTEFRQAVAVAALRSNLFSWASQNYPAHDFRRPALEAAREAEHLLRSGQSRYNVGLDAAFLAALSIGKDDINPSRPRSIERMASRYLSEIQNEFWAGINWDCDSLLSLGAGKNGARRLVNQPLWPRIDVPLFHTRWKECRNELLAQDENASLWIDWYERRIRGERASFNIPNDRYRIEDKALLRKLAEIGPDFWSFALSDVNFEMRLWLDDARTRASQREDSRRKNTEGLLDQLKSEPAELSNPTQIAPRLQSAASPQAAERDGKLDAGPNKQFDQPRFSGDLADLPSELRSFVRVLSGSLGENASRFMRSSLAEYENEVLVRGNRPILGTLKGLASAIAREVWSAQSIAASDDPDDWQMRDEREWGPGMADMFRTFFRYHRDLITHFPLDEEREELLRATPIDEMAASGEALTNPVELVTGLIRDLHAQDMATDDILKIVEAHAQYNANIATLPPPERGLPSDYVTPKRRHVLMTAGFYLHLYSVLGSTASLWPVVAANPALATQIQSAAEALLRFIL